jgi:hypothetical protein
MAKEQKAGAAPETPSYFDRKVDTLEGFEQITQDTMAIPFVRILQKLNPQLDKNKPEFIEGAEEGDFFNTVTREVYKGGFEFVCLDYKHMYIEWRPNRGGFAGRHDAENATRLATMSNTIANFGKWETPEGNSLQENYAYVGFVVGRESEGIVVLSYSSSMIKAAREWNRLMTTHVMPNGEVAAPYYLVWHVGSEYRKNEKGSWYVQNYKFVRYVTEPQLLRARNDRKTLPAQIANIDYKQLEGGELIEEGEAPATDKY